MALRKKIIVVRSQQSSKPLVFPVKFARTISSLRTEQAVKASQQTRPTLVTVPKLGT